jgi:hypothetical protein
MQLDNTAACLNDIQERGGVRYLMEILVVKHMYCMFHDALIGSLVDMGIGVVTSRAGFTAAKPSIIKVSI